MQLTSIIRRGDIATLYALPADALPTQLGGDDRDEALLRGRYSQSELRDGLHLHTTDAIELTDLTSRFEHRPGLSILLFLQGHVDVSFGGRRLLLGRGGGNDGVLALRARPELCVRRSTAGTHIRKLSLTASFDWLRAALAGDHDDGRALDRLLARPERLVPLTLTPRLTALAEQILRPPAETPLLANLFLEQRAIALVIETLRPLIANPAAPTPTPTARDAARLARVARLIEAADPAGLSLDALARAAGMSEATLQRLFKDSYGTPVFEHIRARRMEAAYAALVAERISIAEAAHRAGYGSAANFATAFKRRYGLSPKAARG